jgi:hypothetical protein
MVINILRNCDELLAICDYPSNDILVYEGLKGELYLSARYQLDKLGVASKLLSNSLHCEPLPISDIENVQGLDITVPEEFCLNVSNESLKQIMLSKTSFDAAYEKLSQKCFRSFEICKRPGTVSFLKADLAFLHFARQNYAKAAEIFEELCFKYAENGWNHIDTVLIERYSICQRQLNRTNNLVRSFLHLVQFPDYLILESVHYYLEQLKESAKEEDTPYLVKNSCLLKLISLTVVDELALDMPVKAELVICSTFPQQFYFNTLRVIFTAGDGAQMTFEGAGLTFEPGNNIVILSSDVFETNVAQYCTRKIHRQGSSNCISETGVYFGRAIKIPKTGHLYH